MLEKLIKRCDMFSIIQFTRYNGQKSYRTLTGGIVSILLYASLLAIFVGQLMETLEYSNITVTSEDINFQLNPTPYQLQATPKAPFMFAVGITGKGIDLASFDVALQSYTVSNKNYSTDHTTVLLKPCNASEWTGINAEISASFHGLNLQSYLCPPLGYILELQGKPTSEVFKYTMISVGECGKFNPQANCSNATRGPGFDLSHKLNFFYINSQVNPKNKEAVSYYIEDVNIFDLDLSSSFVANIYFSEFEVNTDRSLMPWPSNHLLRGIYAKGEATTQSHTLQDNIFARIILRKSSQKLVVWRSFEKITKPISYIGGLSGPILMVLSVLRMYATYAFEIEFGGKIFRQQTESSFDSQRFNFLTYLKCRIYNILKNCGLCREWRTIKDYYECRRESIKQLDVHLLHKKMIYFEEVCNMLIQKHYQVGLHLLPSRSIHASALSRLKYFYQTSIETQEKQEAKRKLSAEETSTFIEPLKLSERKRAELEKQQQLQKEFWRGYLRLRYDSETGDELAEGIMSRIKDTAECARLERLESTEWLPEETNAHGRHLALDNELVQTETNEAISHNSQISR